MKGEKIGEKEEIEVNEKHQLLINNNIVMNIENINGIDNIIYEEIWSRIYQFIKLKVNKIEEILNS